jgi:hypothetical protein
MWMDGDDVAMTSFNGAQAWPILSCTSYGARTRRVLVPASLSKYAKLVHEQVIELARA